MLKILLAANFIGLESNNAWNRLTSGNDLMHLNQLAENKETQFLREKFSSYLDFYVLRLYLSEKKSDNKQEATESQCPCFIILQTNQMLC